MARPAACVAFLAPIPIRKRSRRHERCIFAASCPRACASRSGNGSDDDSGNGEDGVRRGSISGGPEGGSGYSGARRLTAGVQRAVATAKGGAEAARVRFEAAKAAARELEGMQIGGVLGADLENTALGRVSEVQDLDIPPSVVPQPLRVADVVDVISGYVREREGEAAAEDIAVILRQVLDSLRRCVAEIVDNAEELIGTQEEAGEWSDARVASFLGLLELAGFHCNAPPPLRPAALTSYNMAVSVDGVLDATLFDAVGKKHSLVTSASSRSEVFPHILLAFRGTGVDRASGLLIGAKIRSLESYYLGWLNNPVEFARKLIRRRSLKKGEDPSGTAIPTRDAGRERGKEANRSRSEEWERGSLLRKSGVVRRVFPSAKINGWEGAADFMLPVFSQEPTHSLLCVAYRRFTPDGKFVREAKKQELLEQARVVAERAVSPTKILRDGGRDEFASANEPGEMLLSQPPGKYGPLRIELWNNVPWGHLQHFLPLAAAKVAPRARDILRIDFLTFAGLSSALVTIAKGTASPGVLAAEILGTVAVYTGRIALRLRSAISKSRGLIAEERSDRLAASDGPAMTALGLLATQQQFGVAASIMAAAALAGSDDAPTVAELQRELFGVQLSDDALNQVWTRRLVRWQHLSEELRPRKAGHHHVEWEDEA